MPSRTYNFRWTNIWVLVREPGALALIGAVSFDEWCVKNGVIVRLARRRQTKEAATVGKSLRTFFTGEVFWLEGAAISATRSGSEA